MAAVLATVRVTCTAAVAAVEAGRRFKEPAESGSGIEMPGTTVLVQKVSSARVLRHLAEGM